MEGWIKPVAAGGGDTMKTLDEATRIKESVEGEWLKRPGVEGMDVGFAEAPGVPKGTPVIRVYVDNRERMLQSSAIPTDVQGVPVIVIERRFRLHYDK
jgi:hypothetical protein